MKFLLNWTGWCRGAYVGATVVGHDMEIEQAILLVADPIFIGVTEFYNLSTLMTRDTGGTRRNLEDIGHAVENWSMS